MLRIKFRTLEDLEKESVKEGIKKSYTSFMASGNFEKQFEDELKIKVRRKRKVSKIEQNKKNKNETSNEKNIKIEEIEKTSLKKLSEIETDSKFFNISEMSSNIQHNISNLIKEKSSNNIGKTHKGSHNEYSINWQFENENSGITRVEEQIQRVNY